MIINANEVSVDSIRYKTTGAINQYLIGNFPEKMVIGDYSEDSHPELSAWSMKDLTGGALLEEMSDPRQANRYWWADSWTRTVGGMRCNPLFSDITIADNFATPAIVNGAPTAWTVSAPHTYPTSWNLDNITASAVITNSGGVKPIRFVANGTLRLSQDASNPTSYRGKRIVLTFKAKRHAGTPTFVVTINDGVSTTTRTITSTTLNTYYMAHTVNAAATQIRTQFDYTGLAGGDEVQLQDISYITATGTYRQFVEFNNQLYYCIGNVVYILSGTTFSAVAATPAAITRMIPSLNSRLYLYLGDTHNYCYMSTSYVVTQSNSAGAYYGLQWDNKLFKFSSTGVGYYSTDPDAASPTWITCSNLSDTVADDLTDRHPVIYQNADGNEAIYWATRKGLKVLDFSVPEWIDTQVIYPTHPNGGKGASFWQGALYVSSGLDILRYQVGLPATLENMGLNTDQGMPSEFNGQVKKLYGSYDALYALVDSSLTSGNSYSSLMVFDSKGWSALHLVDDAYNRPWYDIILTSAPTTYRLYISHSGGVKYLDMPTGSTNPAQAPVWSSYKNSSYLISPWFDANWSAGNKLALDFNLELSRLGAGTNSVKVEYRIDYATTAIAATWTTLGTASTIGTNTFSFGNNGIEFKSIQFKFTMTQAAAAQSPIIKSATMSFQKMISPTWGWQFVLDCSNEYGGRSGEQQIAALEASAVKNTLIPFAIKDTTYYVRIKEVRSAQMTGQTDRGLYQVTVVKLS